MLKNYSLSTHKISLYTIMQNAGLDEAQVVIKFTKRNNNNIRYAGDITLMAESQ